MNSPPSPVNPSRLVSANQLTSSHLPPLSRFELLVVLHRLKEGKPLGQLNVRKETSETRGAVTLP